MVDEYEDVLTDPPDWSWTSGLDHDPVEPTAALLPGRIDAPASSSDGSTAVGQFDSQPPAVAAADALSGICVAQTVILPRQPYPWGGPGDQAILAAAVDHLTHAGASAAFITDADTGYYTQFDIRAHCRTRDDALRVGRQMAPIEWPPLEGLIKPWAPGRRLSEEHVKARLYIASLWRRTNRQPKDELESRIWKIWDAMQRAHDVAAGELIAGLPIDQATSVAMKQHESALHALLGEEPEEWGFPWYLSWKVRVDNTDLCLSFVSGRVATAFPALVRWLDESGVQSARYAVYNLMRP